jgi:hypothetical protein
MLLRQPKIGGVLVESLTDALMERVDKLVPPASRQQLEWGNPLLSTTPTSVAIRDLALRVEALEKAVREIALEVQNLSGETTSQVEST